MPRRKGVKNALIIDSLVFFAWAGLVLLFADYDTVRANFWVGVIGATLAYVVALASRLLEKPVSSNSATEIGFISAFAAEIYLSCAMVINTVFILLEKVNLNIYIPVFVNVTVLLIFISVSIHAKSYQERVVEIANATTNRTYQHVNISRQVGVVLSIAEDPDVKKRLVLLKESIDYSDTNSSAYSQNYENEFLQIMEQIQSALRNNCHNDEVLKMIDDAEKVWKCRTSVVTAIK